MGGSTKDVPMTAIGYHVTPITRGEYGKSSKIKEEVMELLDAEQQGNTIMALIELSDIVGAIKGYIDKNFDGKITFEHVVKMADATNRAFETGARKCT
jgi:hypothetical protein